MQWIGQPCSLRLVAHRLAVVPVGSATKARVSIPPSQNHLPTPSFDLPPPERRRMHRTSQVVAVVRPATTLIPKPIRMNSTPIRIAIPATPKARTDVNSEACRNEALAATSRSGSSQSNSAYRKPPVASSACLSMTFASQ